MEESRAVKIIRSLINLVGVTAGIIITSIGAILFFNALFNLYVFKIDQPEFGPDRTYLCDEYNVDLIEARRLAGNLGRPRGTMAPPPKSANVGEVAGKKLTEAQKAKLRKKYNQCLEKAKKENKQRFRISQKRRIATGLSFVLVGIPLILFYQKRRKEN